MPAARMGLALRQLRRARILQSSRGVRFPSLTGILRGVAAAILHSRPGKKPTRTVGLAPTAAPIHHVVLALLAILLVAALDSVTGRDLGLSLFYALGGDEFVLLIAV